MPMPMKPDPEKYCKHCGVRMNRTRFAGRMEDLSSFLRRVYCGRACMAAAMTQKVANRAAHQKRARKFIGDACADCGATDHLHAHHTDSDWSNTSAENIVTLCASCHLKRHWSEGKTHRRNRLRCLGNAVVPAQAEFAIRTLLERSSWR